MIEQTTSLKKILASRAKVYRSRFKETAVLTDWPLALALLLVSVTILTLGCKTRTDETFMKIHDAYLEKYRPLWLEAQAAWWEANTVGSDEAFRRKKKADKAMVELHNDRQTFAALQALREKGRVQDPVHRRLIDVIYRNYLQGQADPDLQSQIIELEAEIEQLFNTLRSQMDDRTLTENEVREVLATTNDSNEAEATWKAYMSVGVKVEDQYCQLVRLRNRLARQLGFENFYAMKLQLQELEEPQFLQLFDELDELTRKPFFEVKQQIDEARAEHFSISTEKLRPWHFGDLFFQEAPEDGEVNLNAVFKEADILDLATTYYASVGLPCEDIVARSDLYEREGKSPHAFCSDLDREGDVRILCNIKPTLYWAATTAHELGHGVYDKFIRRDLPFLLREASHGITTEGVAMMFGAIVKNPDWLVRVRGLEAKKAREIGEAAQRALRMEKLVFSRWTQVMVRFERGIYSDPDQNAGKLWWDLKREYQLLDPPRSVDRPDYAAKMHLLNYPVYYHNYLMGELFAAQVRNHIARSVLGSGTAAESSLFGEKKAGEFLKKEVFGPGNLYSWNELTKRATGETLTAAYFTQQFVE